MLFHEEVDMRKRSIRWVLIALASASAIAPAMAQQYSRSTRITYYDHAGQWVLGQISDRTVNGVSVESTTFDTVTALPVTQSSYGKLQSTLAYNPDGTLSASRDAAGNATHYGNWKRGVPQTITNADGTTQSAVVNDRGWITQVTDENGSVMQYGYDSMGRISSITPPTGDTVNWTPTTQVFESVGNVEHGIAAGHWRQTITTGNAVKVTYFDALWRPLIVWEYDAARLSETQSFLRFAYDSAGRAIFASYPSASSSPTSGIWTEFDALGRTIASSQDSEQGLLITTTTYGADATGPYTVVTEPGGAQTRSWYQVFSTPSYDVPIRVQRPNGAVTTIARDIFGKPESIIR